MAREQDFYSEMREDATNLWNALNNTTIKRLEWDRGAYLTNLPDGAGNNSELTANDLGNFFNVVDAINEVITEAHQQWIVKLL